MSALCPSSHAWATKAAPPGRYHSAGLYHSAVRRVAQQQRPQLLAALEAANPAPSPTFSRGGRAGAAGSWCVAQAGLEPLSVLPQCPGVGITYVHCHPLLFSSVCHLCGGRVFSLGHNSEVPEEGRSNIPAQGRAAMSSECRDSLSAACIYDLPTDVISLKTLHLKIRFYAKFIQIFSPFPWLDRTEPALTPRCLQTCIQQHGFLQRARVFSRVLQSSSASPPALIHLDPHSLRTLMGAPLNSTPGLFFSTTF